MKNIKKIQHIIFLIITVLVISIAIIRIFQALLTIYLYYDSVYSIGNFSIITLKTDYRMENNEVKIMQYFPSLFYKSTEINVSPETVRERNGKGEAFIKCSLPYFIILLFCIFIIKYKIIPKME